MSSPDGQEASAGAGEVVSPGLLARLMAAVRPEFRRDVLRFDAADPVFGGPACGVPGCARLARGRGLCLGHHSRWRQHGSPDLERFTATASPRFAREVLACCQAPGCRYGVVGHGLCGRHLSGWRRAGRPELAGWLAVVPPVPGPKPACPVPGCGLWAQPAWPFCRSHGRAWIYHGRPDTAGFLARFSDRGGGIPAYESIDLRGLPPHLKLEVQYALQCRRDEEAIKTPPDPVRGVVRFLQDAGLASFLDWPEETWRRRFPAANARTKVHAALAIYARRAVESLAYGHGWQVEYPRDDWRLRSLGISGPRATISFGQISQPWLRELAKRWTRWRLSAGLGPQQAGYGVLAIARLSEFLVDGNQCLPFHLGVDVAQVGGAAGIAADAVEREGECGGDPQPAAHQDDGEQLVGVVVPPVQVHRVFELGHDVLGERAGQPVALPGEVLGVEGGGRGQRGVPAVPADRVEERTDLADAACVARRSG